MLEGMDEMTQSRRTNMKTKIRFHDAYDSYREDVYDSLFQMRRERKGEEREQRRGGGDVKQLQHSGVCYLYHVNFLFRYYFIFLSVLSSSSIPLSTLPKTRAGKFVPPTANQFTKILLPEASKWFELGQYLAVAAIDLKQIRQKCGNNDQKCLTELHSILKRKGKLAWEGIAVALRKLGNNALADSIHHSNHCTLPAIHHASASNDKTTTGILDLIHIINIQL